MILLLKFIFRKVTEERTSGRVIYEMTRYWTSNVFSTLYETGWQLNRLVGGSRFDDV